MDRLIKSFYKSYGSYVNHARAFPLDIDGLKPVERRVLLSTYQIAREKLVKCARVDGHTIGHFHPHGSAYGTLVQLVHNGFLQGQGNFGSKIGVEATSAAAMRYTECKLKKDTVELAFKYIKHVPWVESELDDEPAFLPTMFPLCLMGTEPTQGIGFGFRTHIPCYDVKDLHKRLEYLLGHRKRKPIIKPILDCNILSDDSVLEELLTVGKAKLEVEGNIELQPQKFKALLRSWVPGKTFESGILKKFGDDLASGDIAFTDLSRKGQTVIAFEVIKQRNRPALYAAMIKKLKDVASGSVSYECIVVDREENVKLMSIDDMLIKCHKTFIAVNQRVLEEEIIRVNAIIDEHALINTIRPFISKHLNNNDVDVVIKNIATESKTPEELVKQLFSKYTIRKLFTVNIDAKEHIAAVKEFSTNLEKVEEYSFSQYARFK